RERADLPRLESHRARTRRGRPGHRAVAAALPGRSHRPPPARRPANRLGRGARRRRLWRVDAQPAGAAARAAAAPHGPALAAGGEHHRHGGDLRHRLDLVRGPVTWPVTATPTPGEPEPPLPDDPEESDPGLARERTSLAWTRTAISFAALGGVVLKVSVASGLIILAMAAIV